MIALKISTDFSKAPGSRYKSDSECSAEEFRELLLKKLTEAEQLNVDLIVDLDGTYGYAASFVEEAFLGLTVSQKNRILFLSEEEPDLIDEIKENWSRG